MAEDNNVVEGNFQKPEVFDQDKPSEVENGRAWSPEELASMKEATEAHPAGTDAPAVDAPEVVDEDQEGEAQEVNLTEEQVAALFGQQQGQTVDHRHLAEHHLGLAASMTDALSQYVQADLAAQNDPNNKSKKRYNPLSTSSAQLLQLQIGTCMQSAVVYSELCRWVGSELELNLKQRELEVREREQYLAEVKFLTENPEMADHFKSFEENSEDDE